jgi:hypothetical protein
MAAAGGEPCSVGLSILDSGLSPNRIGRPSAADVNRFILQFSSSSVSQSGGRREHVQDGLHLHAAVAGDHHFVGFDLDAFVALGNANSVGWVC